jgi:hypothetical protein
MTPKMELSKAHLVHGIVERVSAKIAFWLTTGSRELIRGPSVVVGERAAERIVELFRGLRAMNGWPRGAARPQCLQRPLDTCRDAAGPIAAGKWFPRSCRAGNGGTKQRPGSVPAEKSSPALVPLTTLIPSARGLRRTRRNESSASLRTGLRKSNQVEHSEASKHFGSNHTRRSARPGGRARANPRSSQPRVCALESLS